MNFPVDRQLCGSARHPFGQPHPVFQVAGNQQSSLRKIGNPVCGNPAIQFAGIQQTGMEANTLDLINQVQPKSGVLAHVLRRRFASPYSVTHWDADQH